MKFFNAITEFNLNPTYEAFKKLNNEYDFVTKILRYLTNEELNTRDSDLIEQCIFNALELPQIVVNMIYEPLICYVMEKSGSKSISENSFKLTLFNNTEEWESFLLSSFTVERSIEFRKCSKFFLNQMLKLLCTLKLCQENELENGINIAFDLLSKIWLSLFTAENTNIYKITIDTIKIKHESTITYPKFSHIEFYVKGSTNLEANFDQNYSLWKRNELSDEKLNILNEWLLKLVPDLFKFIEEARMLTNELDPDVLKIRAAGAIIKISDLSKDLQNKATKEGWMKIIFNNLWFTNDLLLKLAASELIINETLDNKIGLRSFWDLEIYKDLLKELQDNSISTEEKFSILRLLVNLIEHVPESADQILNKNSIFTDTIKKSIDHNESKTHILSILSCLCSNVNSVGNNYLTRVLDNWLNLFIHAAKYGTECEAMACVTGLLRILGGTSGVKQPKDQDFSISSKIRDNLVEPLTMITALKPWPACKSLIYRFLEIMALNFDDISALNYIARSKDRQEEFFNAADSPDVKQSKHKFIKAAYFSQKEKLFKFINNKDFVDSVEYYANRSAYDIPPKFKRELSYVSSIG